MRVAIDQSPGAFARVATAIGAAGGDIGAIDIARSSRRTIWRDVTVNAVDSSQAQRVVDAVAALEGIAVEHVSDRTFLMHLGGKLEIQSRVPLKTRDDLSMAYTPGVARICKAIAENPDKAWALTIKRNTVAVVSDGSAVLGLGDIGPEAAMPVMEGKALLFKRFANVDAWPLCLNQRGVDEIVETVKAIAPGFGGINLEDISSPRCFEIEDRLRAELDIPVFHDDQHGTAVVVLAALINAAKVIDAPLDELRVVVVGVGAAGVAVTRMLLLAGVHDIVGCDRHGAIHAGRTEGMNEVKEWYAAHTNPQGLRGSLAEVITGANVFIGVSGPGVVTRAQVATMSDDAIVFAMANPTPELMPEEAPPNVRIMATGRSDYPNQINNVLCFPGIFRGALDVRAREITEEMKLAAAHAIAAVIPDDELAEDHIIPSVFNPVVAEQVAKAVGAAAGACNMSRAEPPDTVVLSIPGGRTPPA